MPRRFLLRSLALAGIIAACFAHLIWNGSRVKEIVGENIPYPRLSSGHRDIDMWHPSTSFGRVYDLIFWRAGPDVKPLPAGARLRIQLASNGRTRLLVVRKGHPNTDVSWSDVLTGRERLQIVGDREWIDLGPLPEGEERLDYQISGLLPGPFGFAEPYQAHHDHFSGFRMRRPDSPLVQPVREILRYRFVTAAPVPARETLARFFFFISCSRVLQVTGIGAILLLLAGWWWLWEKRAVRAVACLVPAVTLLHACCLAPLQGADEIAHTATIEALIWNPAMLKGPGAFPKSLARLHDAIDYDGFVGLPDVPVPIGSPGRRVAVAAVLRSRLADDAPAAVAPTADGRVLDPAARASLYYNAFRPLGPLLRTLSVLDRVEAFVAVSALMSLAFFLAGLLVLVRSRVDGSVVSFYGLVALWPYSVGVVASCSNYSLAIGIGQFLAACLVAGVVSGKQDQKILSAALFSVMSVLGMGVWDDFVFFAAPALVVTTILATIATWRLPRSRRHKLAVGAVITTGALATLAFGYSLASGRIRGLVASLGARLPKELGGFDDPSLWLLFAAAAAPLVVCLILVLSIVRSREWTAATRGRAARIRSAAIAILFASMFLATRWTAVPFEATRLDYPDEVFAHWASFWSNNFAFDQDVLSWKMYWGVFGYADVSYPDVLYGAARWACVGLFLALPVLSWRFTQRNGTRSAFLLVASGFALSACIVTNSLRYFAPTNPWGRFILPALPLVVLPLLARAAVPERTRYLARALTAFAILHIWTAITLLGSRYAVGL